MIERFLTKFCEGLGSGLGLVIVGAFFYVIWRLFT
jgi:hypothetical protein